MLSLILFWVLSASAGEPRCAQNDRGGCAAVLESSPETHPCADPALFSGYRSCGEVTDWFKLYAVRMGLDRCFARGFDKDYPLRVLEVLEELLRQEKVPYEGGCHGEGGFAVNTQALADLAERHAAAKEAFLRISHESKRVGREWQWRAARMRGLGSKAARVNLERVYDDCAQEALVQGSIPEECDAAAGALGRSYKIYRRVTTLAAQTSPISCSADYLADERLGYSREQISAFAEILEFIGYRVYQLFDRTSDKGMKELALEDRARDAEEMSAKIQKASPTWISGDVKERLLSTLKKDARFLNRSKRPGSPWMAKPYRFWDDPEAAGLRKSYETLLDELNAWS